MDYVLKTNALCKQYKNFKALDCLNMNVPKGAIYGFVGRNGAGKTTLIRILCGLQMPTSGEFEIYGKKNTDAGIAESRSRMGAVVEIPSLFPEMTAEENLRYQYRLLGIPGYDGITELLKLVGLENTGKKKTRDFSLGMRQRLGIAVALCGDQDILKLNKEHNITFIISSHILDELSKLATHYGFIDSGRIVREMSAEELDEACRKSIRVTVTDTAALARVLDNMGIEYSLKDDTTADVFGRPEISELVFALDKEKCRLVSCSEREETLEGFFISLVGGVSHE